MRTRLIHLAALMTLMGSPAPAETPRGDAGAPPRARQIGLVIGALPPGPLNAITDVDGVRVGHTTLVEGSDIRTGVTAILPHGGNIFQQKVPAAIVVGNGFGKIVGVTQVQELGTLETPIILTNTLATFRAADALVKYMLHVEGNEEVFSINPVVAETNDGFLNDIRRPRVGPAEVVGAIERAAGGRVREGCVGAGTGTRCLGFKGGIGTASRRVTTSPDAHTVGVLVQTNFGGLLTINGAPIWNHLNDSAVPEAPAVSGGSCVIVVATDAPLDARQLRRLGNRALLGLGAVGSSMHHGSGDYVVAFSTGIRIPHKTSAAREERALLHDEELSVLFRAVREAVEEAIINSLLQATDTTGFAGRMVRAVPIDRVVEICKRHGVIAP